MLHPPFFVHLPTQVYCMQSCIVVNMGKLLLRQPNLSKDTVWVVCLYYAKTHTLALYISLPTMQKAGRWPKSALGL